MTEVLNEENICLYKIKPNPRIIIAGVGDAGGKWINKCIEYGISAENTECFYINADNEKSTLCSADVQIQLDPIQEDMVYGSTAEKIVGGQILKLVNVTFKDADIVFIVCGLGGITGSFAAPAVAKMAREMNAFTVSVFSTPFNFEGKKRCDFAKHGMKELSLYSDLCISLQNNRILEIIGTNMTATDAFKAYDEIVYKSISGISKIICDEDLINPLKVKTELIKDLDEQISSKPVIVETGNELHNKLINN